MVAPVPLRPGLTLGDFTLDEKIAVGGMAEIWTAEGAEAPVALKILRPELVGDPTFVAMFEDEVRIATQLRHPNIVDVFGVHEAEGHVLQSMERIDGMDLRRVLSICARSGQRFPIPLGIFVARELARALHHAHTRKGEDGRALDIVHRDVSPHNVMVRRDGRVKLLDFGVARAAERAVKTRTGVIKGKLSYMAPEQALAVGVTPQTDIFAAGVVLWEMLTVERLFAMGSDVEVLGRIVAAQVPPVQEKNPAVPDDVARLLEAMLAQRAPDRPASMEEVERALHRALAVHFDAEVASERGLAQWIAPHLPVADSASSALDEVEADDTLSSPQPASMTEGEEDNDVTATFVRPGAQDETWAGPAPTGAQEGTGSSDPTPPDVARTWVDMSPPDLGAPTPIDADQAPTPSTADSTPGSMTPRRKPDKIRAPTRTEIIRAVENQATVEMEADADVAALAAQFVQVSTPGQSEGLVASPGPDVEALPRQEQPTLLGDLVSTEDGERVVISASDNSDGYETIGPMAPVAPAPAAPVAPPVSLSRPRGTPPVPAAPPRSIWGWLLPGITLALAGLVLVLIYLLIRGR